eukprot:9808138-Lingulodinium_polyedra.AAC.1
MRSNRPCAAAAACKSHARAPTNWRARGARESVICDRRPLEIVQALFGCCLGVAWEPFGCCLGAAGLMRRCCLGAAR